MKDAKLKNLDITYGEIIGKLGLIKWCGDSEVKEVLFIGVTPNWKYLKLMYTDTNHKYVTEITPDQSKADIKYNGDLYYILEVFDNYITDPILPVIKKERNNLEYKLLDKYLETRIAVKNWENKRCIDFESEDKLYSRYDLMHYIMRIFCNYTEGQLSEIEEHYNKTGEIKYDPS